MGDDAAGRGRARARLPAGTRPRSSAATTRGSYARGRARDACRPATSRAVGGRACRGSAAAPSSNPIAHPSSTSSGSLNSACRLAQRLVVGEVGVPRDRLRPTQRHLFRLGEAPEVHRVGLLGEEAEAQFLELGLDRAGAQHVVAHVLPRLEHRRHAATDLCLRFPGGAPPTYLPIRRSCRPAARRDPRPGLDHALLPQVMQRNDPSSTICSSLKCSRRRAQSASSTPAGFQTSMLV